MNYLIYGSSYRLVKDEIDKIIGKRSATIYDMEEVNLDDILVDIGYNSMFDEEKIVILKNISSVLSNKKDDKNVLKLTEYLKDSQDGTTLIMVSKDKIPARGSTKEMLSHLKITETPVITKTYELSKLLGEIIKNAGYLINQNTLNLFAEKCALNYDVALNEFEKLKSIKKKNTVISDADISLYVSNYNVNDIFAFKDAVVNKNLASASKMIDELEYSKMEIVPIVVMLAKEYQTIYNIKLLVENRKTNEEIGKILGNMHPYRVQILRSASSKYDVVSIEKIILYLCDLDRKLISEDNLGYDELRKFLLIL